MDRASVSTKIAKQKSRNLLLSVPPHHDTTTAVYADAGSGSSFKLAIFLFYSFFFLLGFNVETHTMGEIHSSALDAQGFDWQILTTPV